MILDPRKFQSYVVARVGVDKVFQDLAFVADYIPLRLVELRAYGGIARYQFDHMNRPMILPGTMHSVMTTRPFRLSGDVYRATYHIEFEKALPTGVVAMVVSDRDALLNGGIITEMTIYESGYRGLVEALIHSGRRIEVSPGFITSQLIFMEVAHAEVSPKKSTRVASKKKVAPKKEVAGDDTKKKSSSRNKD